MHSIKTVHSFGLMNQQVAHLVLRFSELLQHAIMPEVGGDSFVPVPFLRCRKPGLAGNDEFNISLKLFWCHALSLVRARATSI